MITINIKNYHFLHFFLYNAFVLLTYSPSSSEKSKCWRHERYEVAIPWRDNKEGLKIHPYNSNCTRRERRKDSSSNNIRRTGTLWSTQNSNQQLQRGPLPWGGSQGRVNSGIRILLSGAIQTSVKVNISLSAARLL